MEFNWVEIALAVIAIAGTAVSHLLTKRKYNSEVEKLKAETNSDTIDNMDKSLDFYEKFVEATNKRLDEVLNNQSRLIDENTSLKSQVADMDSKMSKLASIICTKLTCVHREVDEDVINCVYPNKKSSSPKKKK